MEPKEQRELDIDELVHKLWWVLDDPVDFKLALITYTTTIESRMQERCAQACEDTSQEYYAYTGEPRDMRYVCSEAVRMLK